MDQLANRPQASNLGYYQLNQFSIFKNILRPNETLKFPDFLWISRNSFHLEWTMNRTLRRLKNVIMIVEWEPRNQSSVPRNEPMANNIANTAQSFLKSAAMAGKTEFGKSGNDSTVSFSPSQEHALERCFSMFDVDGDGKLSTEDIQHVSHEYFVLLSYF